jgi:hypothetical protein
MTALAGDPALVWPLVCLAVLCAENAYQKDSSGKTLDTDVRRVKISSHTLSSECIHVVAIPGTQSLKDWKMNFNNLACVPNGVLVSCST